VTLTYPHEYPTKDPERCKGHLKALRKHLQREYGPFAALWRLGIQRKGAWYLTSYCSWGRTADP
jgi:muconolactone delta-isomerase